jgi:hypothetical protein
MSLNDSTKLEKAMRLTVRNVSLLVSHGHRPNESFHLHRLSRESLSNESGLVDHSLPTLGLLRSGLDDLEHLLFGNSSNLGQRNAVFRSLVLSPLLNTARQCLGILLTLTIQQVGRQCPLLGGRIVGLLDVALIVSLKGLLELNLLGVSFSVVELGFYTVEFLGYGRGFVRFTSSTFSPDGVGIDLKIRALK